jgi:CheY-specific phosphatase CheX
LELPERDLLIEHKKEHEKFIRTVLEHEQKMTAANFDEKTVKEFTGMLVTWLVYHVADSDQKVAQFKAGIIPQAQAAVGNNHSEMVCNSVMNTLNMMAGLEENSIHLINSNDHEEEDSIAVEVDLVGDITGYITYVYPVAFIKNLVYSVMNYMPEAVEDLELSALFELSNIVSDNICKQILKSEGATCSVTPPALSNILDFNPDERIYIDTGLGIVEADIVVD